WPGRGVPPTTWAAGGGRHVDHRHAHARGVARRLPCRVPVLPDGRAVVSRVRRNHGRAGEPSPPGSEQPMIKPLAYGYMRMPDDMPDELACELQQAIKRRAEDEGFCLVSTYYEDVPCTMRAWDQLLEELKRTEAHTVIVPAEEHLSTNRIMRESMVAMLGLVADAWVLVADYLPRDPVLQAEMRTVAAGWLPLVSANRSGDLGQPPGATVDASSPIAVGPSRGR